MTKKKVKKIQPASGPRLNDVEKAIQVLDARISALESRDNVIVKAFRKGANEIRPLFGLGSIAVVLDGIADRIGAKS